MGARVLFVTGKGGTGKTSVASALAHEAAARGTRVLLVHMPASEEGAAEGEAVHTPRGRVFPSPSLFRERTLDDRRDLEAFLTRVLGLGFLARRLGESSTFSAVAAAAPGLRDLVALSAIATEAARRRGLVIVDAPATGHSIPLLTAPARVLELAPLGPVAREVERAHALVRDPAAFAAVLVTTPEELAIAEVLELRDEVLGAGVASLHVVVNGVWPAYVSDEDGERIAEWHAASTDASNADGGAASGVEVSAATSASPDAALHWRRHRRHAELASELEARVGECARIDFTFASDQLPASDVARLLAALAAEQP